MRKVIISYLLPLFSFSSMVVGIDDLCTSFGWRLFILIVSAVLFVYSAVLIHKKAQWTLIATSLGAAIVLILTVYIGYYSNLKEQSIAKQWLDYIQEQNNEQHYSPLEVKALLEDNPAAQLELAKNYLYGKEGYVVDYVKAKQFAQRSADHSNTDAHELLATIYLEGRGCKPDTASAVSNIVLALKDGQADAIKFFNTLKIDKGNLSKNVREQINSSNKNVAFLDSLESVFFKNHILIPNEFIRIVKKHKSVMMELSDNGYTRATEYLYYYSLICNNTDESQYYSSQLYERGRIPEFPLMRYFFLSHCLGEDYLRADDNMDYVEKCVYYQSFVALAMKSEHSALDSFKNAKYQRYRYNLAQYKRAKYLRDNSNTLYMPSVLIKEDPVECYTFAKACLLKSTDEIFSFMINQPLLFSSEL